MQESHKHDTVPVRQTDHFLGQNNERTIKYDYIGPVESIFGGFKIVPDLSWDIFLAHLDMVHGDPTWDQNRANPNKGIFIMFSRDDIPLMNTKTYYVKG